MIIAERPLWTLYAGGLLWARNCAQKCSVNSVRSVREKSPQRVVCVLSHREGAFYFSQIYTEEQNTQGFTETLSQPISQNLTATFSYNVLWYLYAEGVLWDRNSAQICSVRSVSSVREKTPHELNSAQMSSVKSVRSVREKTHQSERYKSPPWEKKLPKDLLHDCSHLLEELERW